MKKNFIFIFQLFFLTPLSTGPSVPSEENSIDVDVNVPLCHNTIAIVACQK